MKNTPLVTSDPFYAAWRGGPHASWLLQTTGRKDEESRLIISAPPERLNAAQWLKPNRAGWGIESGRLDISNNDDPCRVQSDNGIWISGIFRRIANSLFMEWRTKPTPTRIT